MFVSGVASHFSVCLVIIHWVGSCSLSAVDLFYGCLGVLCQQIAMCFGLSVLPWKAAERTGTLTDFTVAGNTVPATLRRAAERRCFAAG